MDLDGDLFTVEGRVLSSCTPRNAMRCSRGQSHDCLLEIKLILFTNLFLLLCKMYFKMALSANSIGLYLHYIKIAGFIANSVNYLHLGIVVHYKKVCNNNWLSRETHYWDNKALPSPTQTLPNTLFSSFWLFKINAFPMRYEIWKGRKQVRQKAVSNPGWLRQMSTIHALSPLVQTTGLRSAPKKRCKTFIKRKRWCVEHLVLMTQVLQLWQLRRTFFVFFLKDFRSLMKSV